MSVMRSAIARRRKAVDDELAAIEARMADVTRTMRRNFAYKFSIQHQFKQHPIALLVASVAGGLVMNAVLGRTESKSLIKRILRTLVGRALASAAQRWIAIWLRGGAGRGDSSHPDDAMPSAQ